MPNGPPPQAPGNRGFADSSTDTWTVETDLRVYGLTVLFHPKVERIGEVTRLTGLDSGGGQSLARQQPLFAQPGSALGRPLGTKRLSRSPVLLGQDPMGGLRLDPAGSRTAVEINGAPLLGPTVLPPDLLEQGVVLLLGQMIVLLLHRTETSVPTHLPSFDLVGESPCILKLRQDIDRVGELGIPVLVQGEAGTEKTRAAKALHLAGPRRQGPFVTFDMAEAHDPAALHAAFMEAQAGTLFLRRTAQASPQIQTSLSGILHQGELTPQGPQGSEDDPPSGARLVCSSDSELSTAVSAGRFGDTLFRQISEFIMRLPPLRHHREDFGRLFVHRLSQELAAADEPPRLESRDPLWLSPSLWATLAHYRWPGNAEQLRRVAHRLVHDNRGRETVADMAALGDLEL